MKKDTAKLLEELKSYNTFRQFYIENKENMASAKLSEELEKIIAEKGLNKSEIVKKSELNEIYAYQMLSGVRSNPGRNKVLCLIFAMGLDCDEAQALLKKTGYAPLYAKNPADAVVIYSLTKGMSIIEANNLLFEYGQEALG